MLYDELTAHADDEGEAGDIQWNFEKFLVSQDGEVVRRFRPMTTPEDPVLVSAIVDQLEGKSCPSSARTRPAPPRPRRREP